jgi:hypothetical protein
MQESVETMRLVPRQKGDWLALSALGESIQIGVVGATEEEARESFLLALGAWKDVLAASPSGDEPSSAPPPAPNALLRLRRRR